MDMVIYIKRKEMDCWFLFYFVFLNLKKKIFEYVIYDLLKFDGDWG